MAEKNHSRRAFSLPELILSVDLRPVSLFFPPPPHCAPRRGSFRFSSGFSAIFYGAHDVHPGQKDFFQCIELRDLVDARHKRNETILMTKELLKQGTEVN